MLLPPSIVTEAHYEPQKLNINDMIALSAEKYDVSEKTMHRVIQCESRYNPKAVGDYGHSFGLVQIHLPSHPDISKAQAFDPEFATDYLAKSLSRGQGKMWTCFRMIGKV